MTLEDWRDMGWNGKIWVIEPGAEVPKEIEPGTLIFEKA